MATELSSLEWIEILQNDKIIRVRDISIFQTMYGFPKQAAASSQIGLILGSTAKNKSGGINLEIWRLAERISKYYDINFTERSERKYKFWDLFFNGWDEGSLFIWQLRTELKTALEETGLTGDVQFPEEIPTYDQSTLVEGLKRTITVNIYERNSQARKKCIQHWGSVCSVCDFEFEKQYGELGKGFIHVHHLIPISEVGQTYQVDPISDLLPVCPNCHAMLHRANPPLTIDELKAKLKK